jgi:hypothetical protein
LRKLIPIVLIIAFAFQCLSSFTVLVDFYSNRAYIAENICVNRFEAIPICKGQCYLNKELKKTEKNEKKTSTQKEKEVQNLPLVPIIVDIFENEYQSENKVIIQHQTDIQFSLIESVFHPPQFS